MSLDPADRVSVDARRWATRCSRSRRRRRCWRGGSTSARRRWWRWPADAVAPRGGGGGSRSRPRRRQSAKLRRQWRGHGAGAGPAEPAEPVELQSQSSITIPRQYPALWVFAGLALVAAVATLAWWKRGAAEWTTAHDRDAVADRQPATHADRRFRRRRRRAPRRRPRPMSAAGEPTPRAQPAKTGEVRGKSIAGHRVTATDSGATGNAGERKLGAAMRVAVAALVALAAWLTALDGAARAATTTKRR